MLRELDDSDWAQAFQYAGEKTEESYCQNGSPNITMFGSLTESREFCREDVKRIIAIRCGENDGPAWICIGELNDGLFFNLEAGCDYTGWDCQAGGSAILAGNFLELLTLGCTQENREEFCIELTKELGLLLNIQQLRRIGVKIRAGMKWPRLLEKSSILTSKNKNLATGLDRPKKPAIIRE